MKPQIIATLLAVSLFALLDMCLQPRVTARSADGIDAVFSVGVLDSSFGANGRVVSPISSSDERTGLALYSDGRIVIAGTTANHKAFAVARYNSNGTIDTSFNGLGVATTTFGTGSGTAIASSTVIQPDGKIIAGGTNSSSGKDVFTLVRYNPNGSLDSSFDGDGVLTTVMQASGGGDELNALALQPDGKIVAAGISTNSTNRDIGVARYNTDGSLDTSFNSSGKLIFSFAAGSDDYGLTMVLQPDGKIVVAGATSGQGYDFALVRFASNGSLDTSFGTAGQVVTPIGPGGDFVWSMALRTDGKIVAAGETGSGNSKDFALARYDSDGSLDRSFDSDGIAINSINSGNDNAYAVTSQLNGKIVAAGVSLPSVLTSVRYDGNGIPDLTYGPNGVLRTPVGPVSQASGAVTQPDGKVLFAGVSSGAAVLVRFAADTSCSYELSRTTVDLPDAAATSSSLDVKTGSGCAWTAVSNSPWISVTGGPTGNGAGTVSFTVDANAGAPRIGTISVAGKTFTITQGGVDCAFSLGSNSQYFSIGQASSSVTVNASSPGCAWTATSDASWVSITAGSTGNGNGSVGFTVFGNSGPARAATITVAGREFHITQGTGCIFVLSAQNIALPPGGGTGTFTFTANDPGCGWDAVTGDPWITINGSSSGNGNGTIMVSAPLNNTTTRSGLVYVGAQTIIISQAFGCSTSLSTNTASFGPNGGTGSFNLIAPAGCPWTATSQAGWITITSPASGTGNTTIAYSVDPNPGDNRTGTISSGGVFTVHQTRNPALSKTLFDYDGDRKADISVFRPATSTWYFRYSQIGYNGKEFGASGDIIAPSDYDGDGQTEVAVFRPSTGTWFWFNRTTQNFTSVQWGEPGDIPMPADRDADGKADLVLFRPSTNTWYTRFSSDNSFSVVGFGEAGDKPVLGDFDGDGKGDIAVFRPSNNNWYILKSGFGFFIQTWGESGDIPAPADYDGDGATDLAVFRPSTGQWYRIRSASGFDVVNWGANGDLPVPADYDGDGKADVAVCRPSNATWYIVRTTAGVLINQLGVTTDLPTEGAFIR